MGVGVGVGGAEEGNGGVVGVGAAMSPPMWFLYSDGQRREPF